MDIKTVSEFRLYLHQDGSTRRFFRDTFANDPTAFRFVKSSRTGEVLHDFRILESTAQLSLNYALDFPPEVVEVEIDKFNDFDSLQTSEHF